jgi:anti-sigma regulatory factor (Ser/Thr protein kinase)
VGYSSASAGVTTSNSATKDFHMCETEQPLSPTVHWFCACYGAQINFLPGPDLNECWRMPASSLLMVKRKLEFSSHSGNLALMRKYVRKFLETYPLSEKERTLIVLGVDEACTNIIRYAYELRDDQLIALSMEGLQTCVRLRLRDYGRHGAKHVMKARSRTVLKPGGLGLHLIRAAFDKVDYILKPRGTELVLTKNLE